MAFKVLSSLLLLCFYGTYFFRQFRLSRKGIKTNRLAKGAKSQRTILIETALLICTYLTAGLQLLSIFLSSYLLPIMTFLYIRVLGLMILAFGVIFFLLAITTMQDNWRAGIDEDEKQITMVTHGIYRYSRNPAFVGFDLLYLGSVLVYPNIIICIATLITCFLLHLQILEEERFLPTIFGEKYILYKQNTPRYFLFF